MAEVAATHLLPQLVLGGEVAVIAEALVELPLHLPGGGAAPAPVLRDRDLGGRLRGLLRLGRGRRPLPEAAREGRLDVLRRRRRRNGCLKNRLGVVADGAGDGAMPSGSGLPAHGLPATDDLAGVAPPPRRPRRRRPPAPPPPPSSPLPPPPPPPPPTRSPRWSSSSSSSPPLLPPPHPPARSSRNTAPSPPPAAIAPPPNECGGRGGAAPRRRGGRDALHPHPH